mgnify:CR=1 FL=1
MIPNIPEMVILLEFKMRNQKMKDIVKKKGLYNMRIFYELDLEKFDAWGGAIYTLDRLRKEGLCEQLEFILEDLFPDGMSQTELNDLLWFDSDWIYESLEIDDEE